MYRVAQWLCVWVGVLSVSPWALSESGSLSGSYQVADGKMLRLPVTEGTVRLQQLHVGTGATLLVPTSITGLQVEQLRLAARARISIAPRPQQFEVLVKTADIADGSVIAAAGKAGDVGEAGGHGTDLLLSIESGQLANLTVDLRGGQGGAGRSGSAGASGRDAACWGRGASQGRNGGNGGNGQPGGNGGHLTLELPQPEWLEVIDVLQRGGAGGRAGQAGAAGKGGDKARCWLYSLGAEAAAGLPGTDGRSAPAGHPGYLTVR